MLKFREDKQENEMKKNVTILGPGCLECATVAEDICRSACDGGLPVEVKIISDEAEIARMNVKKTPAVMVDGKLQWEGGIPEKKDIASWLHG
jgi:predicted thioredoxin/glutaredoxin